MSTEFKSFFKAVGGNEGGKCNYATRLDTYGCGCQHNCAYCYARALLDFRGLWDYQNPAVAPIADIRKTIQRELKRGDIVRLGGMTDCFQPLERTRRVTMRTIEELNRRDIGYRHLPLRVKRSLIRQITGFREISVCEDVEQHFAYWQEAVNHNREDCCNLKRYEL